MERLGECIEAISWCVFWQDNLINIIGILIAVIFFITERVVSAAVARKERKDNWFLSIILDPRMEEISTFYSKTCGGLSDATDDLLQQAATIPMIDFLVLKRQYITEFKDRRKNHFINLTSMIRSYDSDLALDSEVILNELDDTYTRLLDSIRVGTRPLVEEMNNSVYENQSKLYGALFSAINTEVKDHWLVWFVKKVLGLVGFVLP